MTVKFFWRLGIFSLETSKSLYMYSDWNHIPLYCGVQLCISVTNGHCFFSPFFTYSAVVIWKFSTPPERRNNYITVFIQVWSKDSTSLLRANCRSISFSIGWRSFPGMTRECKGPPRSTEVIWSKGAVMIFWSSAPILAMPTNKVFSV